MIEKQKNCNERVIETNFFFFRLRTKGTTPLTGSQEVGPKSEFIRD